MSRRSEPPAAGASIGERAAWVLDRIGESSRRAGRPAGSVKLVAVSKTHPLDRVLEAHAAGLTVFGENYVQEAEGKIPGLPGAEWHLIGRLQGNKVRRAVSLFSWIQTVDSARRLREISRSAVLSGRTVHALIEVNLVGEGSKSGAAPGELRDIIEAAEGQDGARLAGLMAIPPYCAEPEECRPYFARLRELRDAVSREFPGAGIVELSMGMSNDFVQAIEEGATMVRVGTAIFGAREGRH